MEVVKMVEKVGEKNLKYSFGPRREGDPASLIADASRIRKELAWAPQFGLEDMVRHELAWVRRTMQTA
jgi:UDP-glucose 4-epimerase